MLASKTLSDTAWAIAQDATLAEVAAALQADGVRPLLIRGPAVARWLYDDVRERPYGDLDLLVDPALWDAAGETLGGLGFRDTSVALRADERHPNESHWERLRDRHVTVDLHHSLSLVGVRPDVAWAELTADMRTITVAGVSIDVPSHAAHLVILALHAAHHGVEQRKPLGDLRRSIDRVDRDTWREAALLGTRLHAAGAMREGLKLVEGGSELAEQLGLTRGATRLIRLHARTPPPTSSGIERLLRTRGTRARLALIAGRFAPSPAYMRQWKRLARRGPVGLALAYLWRPFWLLWHVPGGAAAWLRAALPRERRARIPAFASGWWWALRAWRRCHSQLHRGGLYAIKLPPPPAEREGVANGIHRLLRAASASCLEQSLVLQAWHASRGLPLDVIIGVRGTASDFGAHAWLENEPAEPGVFTELQRWPASPSATATTRPVLSTVAVRTREVPARPVDATAAGIDDTARLRASLGRVALVHDYLNQHGGAEMVVLELADIWPNAPIYTSLYRPESTFQRFREHDIRSSWLERLPVNASFRALFPLYPSAFHSLGEIDADVVIASSSGWAHMARAVPNALHVVYCHTPARWLYRGESLRDGNHRPWQQTLIQPLAGEMRRLDRNAARRADVYIANSREVRGRIRDAYGIDATVVYPPVDIDRFVPRPRGERLLVIGRLISYKRVDLVVRAAARLGIGLDVIGDGPMLATLRDLAGPDVTFHGSVTKAVATELLEGCRAVCVAGEEDFGLVPVEAQAAGKPVIAFAGGGALETVTGGVTGVFFYEQNEESLVAAIVESEKLDTPPEVIAEHAKPFSRAAFRRNLLSEISSRLPKAENR